MSGKYLRLKSNEMLLAKYLVRIGVERARTESEHNGWICGTYTSSLARGLAVDLHNKFSDKELEVLCHHWGLYKEENKTQECLEKDILENDIDILKLEAFVLDNFVPKVHVNFREGLIDKLNPDKS